MMKGRKDLNSVEPYTVEILSFQILSNELMPQHGENSERIGEKESQSNSIHWSSQKLVVPHLVEFVVHNHRPLQERADFEAGQQAMEIYPVLSHVYSAERALRYRFARRTGGERETWEVQGVQVWMVQ
jgi:hypothetical protein